VRVREQAEVSIDGAIAGVATPEAPLRLEVPAGPRRLRLVYANGAKVERKVFVPPSGEQESVFDERPSEAEAERLGARLDRWRWGFGGGMHVHAYEPGGNFREFSLGPSLDVKLSRGLLPAVDLEVGGVIETSAFTSGPFLLGFHLQPRAVFHLGSLYTMSAGALLSLSVVPDTAALLGAAGGTVSVLGFQFGSRDQHRIELDQSFQVGAFSGFDGRDFEPRNVRPFFIFSSLARYVVFVD
jgi:hypothetical protein